MTNHADAQYLETLHALLTKGDRRDGRNGGTLSLFGEQLKQMSDLRTRVEVNWDTTYTLGDDPSVQMHLAEVLMKPNGAEFRLVWMHAGEIKIQWVPEHLLVEYQAPT